MQRYEISGGRPLKGQVKVHGAKNSALPILCASLLSGGVCEVHNCPALSDVDASIAILRHLGCSVERTGSCVVVDPTGVCRSDVPDALMREMRSSVLFLGAILARTGEARVSMPGGCELGPRPIDLHLKALGTLGAQVEQQGARLCCSCGQGLRGEHIYLALPSVGATENAMLASCAARGTTYIHNAAREPEIVDLARFLRAMGAEVYGEGSSTVWVEGGKALHGCAHTVIGDRIVAATYLSACACAGGDVTLTGIDPDQCATVTAVLGEGGAELHRGEDWVRIQSEGGLRGVSPIRTAPYPGFPTDAQPVVMAALCRGQGTTVFVETMFENRYRHVDELRRMGACLRGEGRVALVTGVKTLHAAPVEAHDLRGGGALCVAALGAVGESTVTGVHHIRRGYASLPQDLNALGAEITERD